MVRVSPYNAQGKRMTSFASVFVTTLVEDVYKRQVYNSSVNKLFKVSVDNFSVTYNCDCPIKDEYKSRTIIGTWTKTGGAYSKFIMESQEFDKMYNCLLYTSEQEDSYI